MGFYCDECKTIDPDICTCEEFEYEDDQENDDSEEDQE
jgi:hypothetical protein